MNYHEINKFIEYITKLHKLRPPPKLAKDISLKLRQDPRLHNLLMKSLEIKNYVLEDLILGPLAA